MVTCRRGVAKNWPKILTLNRQARWGRPLRDRALLVSMIIHEDCRRKRVHKYASKVTGSCYTLNSHLSNGGPGRTEPALLDDNTPLWSGGSRRRGDLNPTSLHSLAPQKFRACLNQLLHLYFPSSRGVLIAVRRAISQPVSIRLLANSLQETC